MRTYRTEIETNVLGKEVLILADDCAFPIHRWGNPSFGTGLFASRNPSEEELLRKGEELVGVLSRKDVPVGLPEIDHPAGVAFFESVTHEGFLGLPLFERPKVHAITMLSPHLWLLGYPSDSDFLPKDMVVKTYWGAQFATGEASRFGRDGDGWIDRSELDSGTMRPIHWMELEARYPEVWDRIEAYLAEHGHVALPPRCGEATRERLAEIRAESAPAPSI